MTRRPSFDPGHHGSAVKEGRSGWQRNWAKVNGAFRKQCCGCLNLDQAKSVVLNSLSSIESDELAGWGDNP